MSYATRETLLSALPQIVETARKYAEQGERERNLAPAVADAFVSAGVFRICRPSVWGGLELDPRTTLEVLEALGAADGSAGWCAMVSGGQAFAEAFVPLDGGLEMFSSPTAVTAGVGAPQGRAVQVDGGYRISGRWGMASNCRQTQWLVAGCIVFEGDAPRRSATGGPEMIFAHVPTSDCKILDTWDVSGLRATGSNDFELAGAFVPGRRCARVPSEPSVESTLNLLPVLGFNSAMMSAVALGVCRAALDEFIRVAKPSAPSGGKSTPLANRAYAQLAYAKAEATWQSSRAYLHSAVDVMWAHVRGGERLSLRQTASLRMASSHVIAACAEAIDTVYTTGGSTSLYTKSPMQRYFRDIHAITQHAFLATPVLETVGRVLLQGDGDVPLL